MVRWIVRYSCRDTVEWSGVSQARLLIVRADPRRKFNVKITFALLNFIGLSINRA